MVEVHRQSSIPCVDEVRSLVVMPGGYVDVERLETGKWTSLYRAVRADDGCHVLLEVLNSERRDAERARLLASQLAIGQAVDSPFVLRPLGVSELEGRAALELEDGGGVPLDAAFAGAPTTRELVQLAVLVTSAVADLHARGVVHGALAKRYLLFHRDPDRVKLFGLWHAQQVTLEGVAERPMMRIEDSLPYVSPEQTGRLNRRVDRRSDLYSLGVVFFELITGRLPFEAKDAVGWVHGHLARKPPHPSEISASVPAVLSSIVLKLLEKSPDDRYQSAAGLLHDLELCLSALRAGGPIAPFALGRADISDVFMLPRKLYGREGDRARLLQSFERALTSGSPRLILVSGASGCGKSSLVHELQAHIALRDARFVSGKFDSFERELPYSAVLAAFRELVLDVVAEGADVIASYQPRIRAAFGRSAPLVCELLPELELILGPQLPVQKLPPAEIEQRVRRALRRLLAALATSSRPVLFFLDDLQWIDRASIGLLVDWVQDTKQQPLLIVAAHPEGELDSSHPLRQALDDLGGGARAIEELQLGPLSVDELAQMVADLAHVDGHDALPLARSLHAKTYGNPLFVVQLLSELHRRKLIVFDPARGCWRWDLAAIVDEPCSENVTELLVVRLRALPAETQQTLGRAAHLGRSFDPETLSMVMTRAPGPALDEALAAGLLSRVGSLYQFPHDRVRDAAYSLVPASERAALHLTIGRRLLGVTPPDRLDERSFEIVRHLSLSTELMTSDEEREQLAQLHLRAGRRAQASAAPAAARSYFSSGRALLDQGAWEARYELAFALGIGLVESELALGNQAAADDALAEFAGHVRGFVDRAAVVRCQVASLTARGEFARALELLFELLRGIGIDWCIDPDGDAVQAEYERLRRTLAARPIESLLELGAADATTEATMEALFLLVETASSFGDGLLRLGACRMASISLERGPCDASPLAFVYLGQMMGPYFGDYAGGFDFARFGLELQDARQQARFSARTLAMAGAFVYPWTQPIGRAIELLHRAFDAAQKSDEPVFAWLALRAEVSLLLSTGASLRAVAGITSRAREFTQSAKLGPFFQDLVLIEEQLIRALRGTTSAFPAFDDAGFDESRFEAHLRSDRNLVIAEGWYWIRKLQARYLGGDVAGMREAAVGAEALLWTTGFAIERVEYYLYRALALGAELEVASPEAREGLRAAMAECVAALQARARDCPSNFASRAALADAELARVDEEPRAAQAYEHAIRLARDHQQLSVLALSYEAAAAYYRARGFDLIEVAYLREALSAYSTWGAEGKVRQLEQRRPSLALAAVESTMLDLRTERLDLLAVIKASQTLSSVTLEDQVLQVLLQIVLEQGGARRARLVLTGSPSEDAELHVAAEASIDDATPLLQSTPRVPTSIVDYVRRTGSMVLFEDAMADAGRFVTDPYLVRARPRSLLCLPVRRHGALAGILYLDNDLAPGVFTPDRLIALELLATQAAVSLQNASLLARERAAREEAQRDQRRALLLGQVTALLSETDDRAALSGALRLVCEHGLADWTLLTLTQTGSTTCIAHAHRDAIRAPLLAELAERYAPEFCARALAHRELSARAPLHQASLSDEQVRAHCVDDGHAALSRKLGMRSLLAVPVLAGGAKLGVLFLMAAAPHRFQPADVSLATELGRRIGTAVEGARLAELERLLQRSQKMEAIGRLAGGVAHDFNNVLCVILGYSLLVREKLDAEHSACEELDEIIKGAERGAELTRRLLLFSRHRPHEPGIVDVNQVVGELQHMLKTLIGSQIQVTFHPGENLWKTRVDRGQLEQLLLNLAANARDAMPDGGTLVIETTNATLDEAQARKHLDAAPGEYLSLAVTDTGCGMDPEVRARIFEPFFTTKEPGKGTGLGLATVFGFVRQSGGHIAVESEVGRGTTFRIFLPRSRGTADAASLAPIAPAAPFVRGSETVLLVDDDDQLRGTVRAILRRHGYTVLDAGSPGDALLLSEQYSPNIDILLTDIVLPHMSGPELAERIIAARPGIRLLFVSGYTETPVPRSSLVEYQVDVLEKPFTPQKLVEAVRRTLDLQSENGTHHSA
jgi:predicted ATPase/signal transduction histidine kinase/ActR/RegA family two-component response regulator